MKWNCIANLWVFCGNVFAWCMAVSMPWSSCSHATFLPIDLQCLHLSHQIRDMVMILKKTLCKCHFKFWVQNKDRLFVFSCRPRIRPEAEYIASFHRNGSVKELLERRESTKSRFGELESVLLLHLFVLYCLPYPAIIGCSVVQNIC